MNCKEIQYKLIDYIDDNLPAEDKQAVTDHLKHCASCHDAYMDTERLFGAINKHQDIAPPEKLKKNFYTMLENEKVRLDQTKNSPSKHIIFRKHNLAIAAQVILLIGLGFVLGWYVNSKPSHQAEIAQLQTQVQELNERLYFTSLNQPTASRRIQAINAIQKNQSPDERMMEVLINTMNSDENVNVRMAAIYALSEYRQHEKVKTALIESLGKQTNPILQITLINIIVSLNDERGLSALQNIADNEQADKQVKSQAKQALSIQL